MPRTLMIVLLLAALQGCIGWSRVQPPLEHSLRPERGPHTVRVVMLDSSSVVLVAALADSVQVSGYRETLAGEFVAIPMSAVRQVQQQRFRVGTALLVLLVVVAVAADGFAGIFAGLLP